MILSRCIYTDEVLPTSLRQDAFGGVTLSETFALRDGKRFSVYPCEHGAVCCADYSQQSSSSAPYCESIAITIENTIYYLVGSIGVIRYTLVPPGLAWLVMLTAAR